jgi:hypothetical protein
MITVIKDLSQVTEKKLTLFGFKKTTWNVNRETVTVDDPNELEIAAYACHRQLVRFEGKLYEPLNPGNSNKLALQGQTMRFFDGKPHLLVQNTKKETS